jgi:hypothetical protein
VSAPLHPLGGLRGWFILLWRGARQALQWRLLLLWLAALALPLLLAMLPLWAALAALLDRATLGVRLVHGTDIAVLAETLGALGERGTLPAAALGSGLVFLALLPWIAGVAMAAARAPQPLGFAALLQGGLHDYGRMARLWMLALLPLGIAAALAAGVFHLIGETVRTTTLEDDAAWLGRGAAALALLLVLLAHATVDAARAQLVLEPRQRSVWRAWWRGLRGLRLQPARLLLYAAPTAAGLLLAGLVGVLRLHVAPATMATTLLALLLGQAVVLVLGWMRAARLFALVAAARRGAGVR